MRRLAPTLPILALLWLLPLLLLPAAPAVGHSPEDAYSARADLRIDEQRGLRVRTWFEVPDASQIARGDADEAVAQLARCLQLRVGGERMVGAWRAGDDPKHGLTNGSHRLFALEFEPTETNDGTENDTLDVRLVVGCFADRQLGLRATARARAPWRIAEETLPAAAGPGHDHGGQGATDSEEDARRARVLFVRD